MIHLLVVIIKMVGDTSQLCMHNEWPLNPKVLEEIYYEFLFGDMGSWNQFIHLRVTI
jgi:hypothetical protein